MDAERSFLIASTSVREHLAREKREIWDAFSYTIENAYKNSEAVLFLFPFLLHF